MLVYLLVCLQLQFKAQVGADLRALGLQQPEGIDEGHSLEPNQIGYDEGGRLYKAQLTRDTPAPQCTKMPPLFRST